MLFTSEDRVNLDPRPRQPGERPWFAWCVSPWGLGIDPDGYLVATIRGIIGRPGVNGITEAGGQLNIGDALRLASQDGYQKIPDDIEVVAFGAKRKGYRVEYVPTKGKPQFHDAWQRWYVEADEWVCEVDAEGYQTFLRRLAADLKPTEAQLQRALRKAREENRKHLPAKPLILGREGGAKKAAPAE